jgi:hypothetical protein
MSAMPPDNDEQDDIDARYRRMAQADTSRPDASVQRAAFAHAARLAAERTAKPGFDARGTRRTSRAWRTPLFGGLAAAALVALLVTPRLLGPDSAATSPHEIASPAPPKAESYVAADKSAQPAATASPSPRAAPAPKLEPTRKAGSDALDTANSSASTLAANRRASAPTGGSGAGDPSAALRRAAESGDVQSLSTLLDEKANLDSRDSAGRTALMLAVINGRTDLVNALLVRGADPNVTDSYGETALHAATAGNHTEIAAALRRAGAH